MLSILIPVYNYNIIPLVNELHKLAIESNIKFEIICLEDGSNEYVVENKSHIKNLEYCSQIISKTNNGRIKSRQILSDTANYNWLLFLDADVIPKNNNFIKTYIEKTFNEIDAIYGGITYSNTIPNPKYILRWKYGKKYEEINANKRSLKPYKNIVSANFLIKKHTFNNINLSIKKSSYGLDNYFGYLLKKKNANILHIDNQVYHLGLEENHIYLKKIEQAVESLLWILNEQKKIKHNNTLLSLFTFLKRYRLHYIMSLFFKGFNLKIRKNLISYYPNMFFLQLYKITYMCFKYLDHKKQTL